MHFIKEQALNYLMDNQKTWQVIIKYIIFNHMVLWEGEEEIKFILFQKDNKFYFKQHFIKQDNHLKMDTFLQFLNLPLILTIQIFLMVLVVNTNFNFLFLNKLLNLKYQAYLN